MYILQNFAPYLYRFNFNTKAYDERTGMALIVLKLNLMAYLLIFVFIISIAFILTRQSGVEFNDGIRKARIVFTQIFENHSKIFSEQWIYIYASNMNGEISSNSDYYFALYDLVKNNSGCKLKVILDEHPADTNNRNAYKMLQKMSRNGMHNVELFVLQDYPNQVNIFSSLQNDLKSLFDEYKTQFQLSEYKVNHFKDKLHFAVSSQSYFRFEFNSIRHLAFFSDNIFNTNSFKLRTGRKTKSFTQRLEIIFDEHIKMLKPAKKPVIA